MDERPKTPGPTLLEDGKKQAHRLTEALRERALEKGEHRRERLTGQLGRIAHRLDELAAPVGGVEVPFARRAADYVRVAEKTLGEHSTEDLLHFVENGIRERPALFLAGCFAVGFGLGRFLRK